jgi:cytochrome P450
MIMEVPPAPLSSPLVTVLRWLDQIVAPFTGTTCFFSGDLESLTREGLLRFLWLQKERPEPVIPLRFGFRTVYLVKEAERGNRLLTDDNTRRDDNYHRLAQFFGAGIFTRRDEMLWRLHRTLVIKTMREAETGIATVWDRTHELIQEVGPEPIDLVRFLSRTTLILFSELVLGVSVADIAPELAPLVDTCLEYLNGALLEDWGSPAYWRFRRARNRVRSWMRVVAMRIQKEGRPSSLRTALEGELTEEKLQLLQAVILGGHETTSRLLLGVATALLQEPELQEPLFEASGLRGEYVQRLVWEGLRLYPPVWLVSRQVGHGDDLVPSGAIALLCPLLMHRDPDRWEEPHRFNPFRYPSPCPGQRVIPGFSPFLTGAENCPGSRFALMEAEVVTQALFQGYRVEPVAPVVLSPQSWGTFRVVPELWVRISPVTEGQ